MKHWPSQLFPLIMLALLAVLSFWLQDSINLEEASHDGNLRHDPDTIVENFQIHRFDINGQLKYRLTAPYLTHYPDDDSSDLNSPTLVSFRPNSPAMTILSQHAKVTSKGEMAYLFDGVRATRAATDGRAEMNANMPDLTVDLKKGIAFTDSPVEITQGQSWVKGVGATLDDNTSTLVLQSQVTGLYFRTRATQ